MHELTMKSDATSITSGFDRDRNPELVERAR
jgi:hypothetical protein